MYSKEFRAKCVEEYIAGGKTFKDISEKYGVAYDTVKCWHYRYMHESEEKKPHDDIKRYKKLIETSNFKDMTEDELRLENIKLQIDNERLKKKYLARTNPITGQKEYASGSKKNTK